MRKVQRCSQIFFENKIFEYTCARIWGFFCMCGKVEFETQVFKFRTQVCNRLIFNSCRRNVSITNAQKTILVPFESSKPQRSIGTRIVLIRKSTTMFVHVLWKWPKSLISVPIQMASKLTYLYLECHTYRKTSIFEYACARINISIKRGRC